VLEATELLLDNRIERIAQPLQTSADLDPLMERIGGAHFVLLGEATHIISGALA
jgi:erythromycin esterase-like protein